MKRAKLRSESRLASYDQLSLLTKNCCCIQPLGTGTFGSFTAAGGGKLGTGIHPRHTSSIPSPPLAGAARRPSRSESSAVIASGSLPARCFGAFTKASAAAASLAARFPFASGDTAPGNGASTAWFGW